MKLEMIDLRRASVVVEEMLKLTFAAEGMDTCLLYAKNHEMSLFGWNKRIFNWKKHQKFWETFGILTGLESASIWDFFVYKTSVIPLTTKRQIRRTLVTTTNLYQKPERWRLSKGKKPKTYTSTTNKPFWDYPGGLTFDFFFPRDRWMEELVLVVKRRFKESGESVFLYAKSRLWSLARSRFRCVRRRRRRSPHPKNKWDSFAIRVFVLCRCAKGLVNPLTGGPPWSGFAHGGKNKWQNSDYFKTVITRWFFCFVFVSCFGFLFLFKKWLLVNISMNVIVFFYK